MDARESGFRLFGQSRGRRETFMNIVEMDTKQVSTAKMYLTMAVPVVLSMLTSMVYNIADTWFISATGNTALIAGVSLNAPVLTFLMAFGNIFGQGGTSLISRLIGQKQADSSRQVSAACFYLAIGTGLLLSALMFFFRTPILQLLGATEETMEYAAAYYLCIAVGAVFLVASYVPMNLLRAEGLSRESMIDSIGGAVLNIILDPIFIFVLGLGAAGAAIATVLGYVFMNVLAVVMIRRKSRMLSVSVREAHTSAGNIAQIFSVGIPAAVTNILQSVSAVVVNQFLLTWGSDAIAAMGIALKVAMVGQMILIGLTFGGLPLFGYYYGGGRKEKFMELLRFCMRFVCITGAVCTVILFAAARPLIRFFVDDASLITMGTQMLRLQVLTLAFAGAVLLLTNVFQSMGRAREMFLLSISRQGILFLAVLIIAANLFGYYGILAAQAAADLLSAALAAGLYLHWKRRYQWPGEAAVQSPAE